jgi:hypothetical protein
VIPAGARLSDAQQSEHFTDVINRFVQITANPTGGQSLTEDIFICLTIQYMNQLGI